MLEIQLRTDSGSLLCLEFGNNELFPYFIRSSVHKIQDTEMLKKFLQFLYGVENSRYVKTIKEQ